MTIYTDKEASPTALEGARIAILGYGSQGRAHARNLRDCGFDLVVGARPGSSAERKARADGFRVVAAAEASAEADLVSLTASEASHRAVYEKDIAPFVRRGATLLVAHGFSIHYHHFDPRHDIDVVLVAPKGPGERVRREFEAGRGVLCLFAVRQDATGSARARALAYARGISGAGGRAIETSFAEETETRLFASYAVPQGTAPDSISAAIAILTEAGYQPEVACFQCFDETKAILDLMHGAALGELVSDTRLVDDGARERMARLLGEIQDGRLAGFGPADRARPGDDMVSGEADGRGAATGTPPGQPIAWPNPQPEIWAA